MNLPVLKPDPQTGPPVNEKSICNSFTTC